MKELKFRAWDNFHKVMIYDGFSKFYELFIKFNGDIEGINKKDLSFAFITQYFNLTQFTGIQDKNGKDIFEGDIITKNFKNGKENIRKRRIVEWNNNLACFEVFQYNPDIESENDAIKNNSEYYVIGNIYENANLLKGVK